VRTADGNKEVVKRGKEGKGEREKRRTDQEKQSSRSH
jgi:hypothetical protein